MRGQGDPSFVFGGAWDQSRQLLDHRPGWRSILNRDYPIGSLDQCVQVLADVEDGDRPAYHGRRIAFDVDAALPVDSSIGNRWAGGRLEHILHLERVFVLVFRRWVFYPGGSDNLAAEQVAVTAQPAGRRIGSGDQEKREYREHK